MPRRNEKGWSEKRAQIIAGALESFSRGGFDKATNQEIARAAGVGSPGLIYHYFADKADLFRATVEEYSPALQLLLKLPAAKARPPRAVLLEIAQTFLRTMAEPSTGAMFRLVLGEAMRNDQMADLINLVVPKRAYASLSRYFAELIEFGVLRAAPPGALARAFVGPLMIYVISAQVFPQADQAELSPDTMAETAVDVFWRGAAAEPGPERL